MSASLTKRRKVGEDDPGGSRGVRPVNAASSTPAAGVLPPPNNGNENTNDNGDDDGDVMIEKESSAWDCLEERFKKNALEGNYLDLTDDNAEGGTVVSVEEAGKTFAKIRRSNEVLVDSSSGATSENSEAAAAAGGNSTNPALNSLRVLVRQTIDDLKDARNRLLQAVALTQSHHKHKRKLSAAKNQLKSILTSIWNNTRQIQRYVDANESAVSEDDAAYHTIEKMNLLIMKANALVAACNKGMADYNMKWSQRGKKGRPDGQGRGKQESTARAGGNAYRGSRYSLRRVRDK